MDTVPDEFKDSLEAVNKAGDIKRNAEDIQAKHVSAKPKVSGSLALFAIFDGHGGTLCASYAKRHVPDLLLVRFSLGFVCSFVALRMTMHLPNVFLNIRDVVSL